MSGSTIFKITNCRISNTIRTPPFCTGSAF